MVEDFKIKWDRCLEIIRGSIGETKTSTWFSPARPLHFENNRLTLGIPSRFFYEKYEDEFYYILSSTLKKVYGDNVQLDYELFIIKNDTDSKVKIKASQRSEDVKGKLSQIVTPPRPSAGLNKGLKDEFDPQLNESLTFENYCIGGSNRLPYTIAEYIANNPGKNDFNPFFLYGSVGVGKTHLIQAIGIRVKERNPKAKVLFVTLRQFQNLMANATIHKQIPSFLNWFQQMDVL